MADMQREPEIVALEKVYSALKPLPSELRIKVLTSLYALLDIPPIESKGKPPADRVKEQATVSKPAPFAPGESNRPLGLVELMREKNPGTNAQRIALFAYYRDKFESIPRFGRGDLEPYFGKAKEQPSRNYDRDFLEAVKKGWLHEDGTDSYITSKGIEAVEAGFPGERKYTKPTTLKSSKHSSSRYQVTSGGERRRSSRARKK